MKEILAEQFCSTSKSLKRCTRRRGEMRRRETSFRALSAKAASVWLLCYIIRARRWYFIHLDLQEFKGEH